MRESRPIVFITNSLSGGGAERAINQVVNSLYEKGVPVILITLNASVPDLVEVRCQHISIDRRWRSSISETFSAFVKFQRLILQIRPRIIVLNCDLPEFFGVLAIGRHKILIVEHVANPWHTRVLFGRIVRFLLRIRRANWVTVSSHFKPWKASQVANSSIPNPINLNFFSSDVQKTSYFGSIRRIVFIGRLVKEQKRPDWILEICKLTNLPALIIGDGEFRSELEGQIQKTDLEFRFLGIVKNPWEHIVAGDLLIVPSAWEGDGLVVVEAISKGVPILLSDIADFRRFGLLDRHYCNEPLDFASRIATFSGDVSLLVVDHQISNRILAQRDIGVINSKWIQLLNGIK
jgi:glycosyltransferase involved in cell wall biosynthesis